MADPAAAAVERGRSIKGLSFVGILIPNYAAGVIWESSAVLRCLSNEAIYGRKHVTLLCLQPSNVQTGAEMAGRVGCKARLLNLYR
jgi:hypothetical protein